MPESAWNYFLGHGMACPAFLPCPRRLDRSMYRSMIDAKPLIPSKLKKDIDALGGQSTHNEAVLRVLREGDDKSMASTREVAAEKLSESNKLLAAKDGAGVHKHAGRIDSYLPTHHKANDMRNVSICAMRRVACNPASSAKFGLAHGAGLVQLGLGCEIPAGSITSLNRHPMSLW
eukprot:scpid94422/ scgid0383/ 